MIQTDVSDKIVVQSRSAAPPKRRDLCRPKIGIFSVAHDIYFEQFPGLEEKLTRYYNDFKAVVLQENVRIFDYGMLRTYEDTMEAVEKMNADMPDILFCNMITYATSMLFAPVVKNIKAPIVLVALQPLKGLDYSSACTEMQLENDNICAVPEYTYTANRLGNPVADVIIGTLYDDAEAVQSLREWCGVARVLHSLRGARIGLMGHVLEAMYDMHADPTAVAAAFGVHVPLLEVDRVLELSREVTMQEIQAKLERIYEVFDMPDPKSDPLTMKASTEDLLKAARAAVALDKLVEAENLTGLAYYYQGSEGSEQQNLVSSFIVGNSLLVGDGIPMSGEYDIKTCIAMLIMDRLGIGGSFAELHPFDFREDFILIGHDGPHHIEIAEGRPVLRSLKKYHGKHGCGVSVEFKLKEGPITMLGITLKSDGRFKMVIGEGYSKHGAIPPTGNTNTRGFFQPNTKDYIKAWVMECPTHHYALGIGHHANTIKKIADILGIDSVIVKL